MSGGGYQVMQALYAIGSGRFLVRGWETAHKNWELFQRLRMILIFSIVCEELGVFGAILLLLMFGYIFCIVCFYCSECA